MPGPWISDDDLADELASLLQRPGRDGLEPFWWPRIARANQAAAAEIAGTLAARGFGGAQVLAFDRGPELNRHLGLYFLLLDGLALSAVPPETVRLYDRRKDLQTLPVTVGGAVVSPAANAVTGGAAVGGRMAPPDAVVREDTVF